MFTRVQICGSEFEGVLIICTILDSSESNQDISAVLLSLYFYQCHKPVWAEEIEICYVEVSLCLSPCLFYLLFADLGCCLALFVVWQLRSQPWQCCIFNCQGRWPSDFTADSGGPTAAAQRTQRQAGEVERRGIGETALTLQTRWQRINSPIRIIDNG